MWGRNEIENPRAIELRAGSIVIIDFQPIYTSSSSSSSSPSLSVVEDVPSESLPDCPEVSINYNKYIDIIGNPKYYGRFTWP